jgi:hypothetical protein
MKLTSLSLRRAADIQDEIEKLQTQLAQLLESEEEPGLVDEEELSVHSAVPVKKKRRTYQTSGSNGSLATVVAEVLQKSKNPLSVAEITEKLQGNGYKFSVAQPKRMLATRIYTLRGVKKVAPGKFIAN